MYSQYQKLNTWFTQHCISTQCDLDKFQLSQTYINSIMLPNVVIQKDIKDVWYTRRDFIQYVFKIALLTDDNFFENLVVDQKSLEIDDVTREYIKLQEDGLKKLFLNVSYG